MRGEPVLGATTLDNLSKLSLPDKPSRKPRKYTPRQRLANAYHEAGHAVIGYSEGFTVKQIEIYERPTKLKRSPFVIGGRVTFAKRRKTKSMPSMIMSLAGAYAEAHYLSITTPTGRRVDPLLRLLSSGWSDFSHVTDHANYLSAINPQHSSDKFFNFASDTTQRKIVTLWDVISRVAEALNTHGHLDEWAFSDIINACRRVSH